MNRKFLKQLDDGLIDKKVAKVKKTVKASKIGITLRFLSILAGVLLAFILFMNICRWFDSNRVVFQQPIIIKLQTPLYVEKRKPIEIKTPVKPTPKKKAKSQLDLFEEAYDLVWLHESNRGKDLSGLNGYCISLGMINEIGYAPHDNYCFNDRTEQHNTFISWLSNRLNHVKMPWCNTISECILNYTNQSYTLAETK